jgi:sugar lactone lactonase YvrE
MWHHFVAFMVATVALFAAPFAHAQTYVPAVVVSSVTTVPTPTPPLPSGQTTYGTSVGSPVPVINPTTVSLDACGNIYVLDTGNQNNQGTAGTVITEIPAGGGTGTLVNSLGNYYYLHLGQDESHTSLIIGAQYGTGMNEIPLTNCIPNTSQARHSGGGSGALFYYYNPNWGVGDFLGNTFISTASTCCVSGNFYLVQEQGTGGSNGQILQTNVMNEIGQLAVDKNQNVYFLSSGSVYELAYLGGTGQQPYAATPVLFGTAYANPVGLSFDYAGNMYVADQGVQTIYEIPYEAGSSTSSGSALNVADQFVVSTGININVPAAVNARGDMYYTAINATSVQKLSLGNANFGTVAIGQTAKVAINFQFNASVSPASVVLPTGVFAGTANATGLPACKATTYTPNTNCVLTIAFTPTSVGKQTGSVILADASGNPIASAIVEGVGQGPSLTLDPGTVSPIASGLKSPTGIVVDGAGNSFIADSTNNSVTEFPAGGGTPVPLAVTVGNLPLSAPTGVGVDGVGNVFIADTGNNRIVEVPSISGALSVGGASVVASGLNSPASVFVRANGDLYVADTGDNTVIQYPNLGGTYGTPIHLGTGLNAPLAATVDASGDLFIADSGNGQVEEIPLGAAQATVAAGLLNPSALTTDASGALFVVDQGNFRVLRIPSVGGVLNPNAAAGVSLGVAAPYGVAIDSSSNLYVTDSTNSAAYSIARTSVDLDFGQSTIGSTSEALPLSVESAGNLPLIFTTPYFTGSGDAGDFAMISPTGACADGVTLTVGQTCDLASTFAPTATGTKSETITFNSNSVVPAQAILSGSGMALATTTTSLALTTPSTGAPFYGEPLVFTATAAGSGSPTGSVSFVLDGVQVALLPLAGGSVGLPLNSGLTGGTHSVYAVYKGDAANDGSASAPLTITIARAPTTSTIAVTNVQFNNPYSLRHSNNGSCSIAEVSASAAHPGAFPAIGSDPVAFVASVSSPGVGIPSGTLSFYADGVLLNSKSTSPNPVPSVVPLAPSGGGFSGGTSSDADTLGDGGSLGQNNVLVSPHQITVVYSGDQNYLPSTSAVTVVNVVDVSPTTPVTIPQQPLGTAPTYCDPSSPIAASQPSDPATIQVQTSSPTVTVSSAIPGTVNVTISSLGGYKGFVDISCPDLPKYTTCSTNPGQAYVQSSKPSPNVLPSVLTLTITTNVPPYVPTAGQSRLFWLPALLLGMLLLFARRRFKQIRTTLALFGLAFLLIGGLTGLSGCGSGSSGSPSAATPAGSYPITLVMQGAQLDTNSYDGGNFLTFQPDLPYSVPLTLVVK